MIDRIYVALCAAVMRADIAGLHALGTALGAQTRRVETIRDRRRSRA